MKELVDEPEIPDVVMTWDSLRAVFLCQNRHSRQAGFTTSIPFLRKAQRIAKEAAVGHYDRGLTPRVAMKVSMYPEIASFSDAPQRSS